MDIDSYDQLLSIIPNTVIATIVSALVHFLYKTLKHIIEKTYEEMIEHNHKIEKVIELVNERLSIVERDTYEIKMQLNSFVTVEKHYAQTKVIDNKLTDVKERVAKIEGRVHP